MRTSPNNYQLTHELSTCLVFPRMNLMLDLMHNITLLSQVINFIHVDKAENMYSYFHSGMN